MPRKHLRAAVQLPISSSLLTVGATSTVTNLSLGGCCVQGSEPGADLTGVLTPNLYLSMNEPPLRVDAAQVCWRDSSQFGLRFLAIEPCEHQRLEEYLARIASQRT